ncbi:MAG: RDD family protein [Nitrospira sp.]|nr:RDD family protein [Nitrospira sp.]
MGTNNQNAEYAGFWVRAGATLIDGILLGIITLPLLISIYGWDYLDLEKGGLIAGGGDFVLSWVFPAIVTVVFWITKQATPGKMAFATRVVDASSGRAPTPSQFVGRYFAYVISTLPLGLGFVWVAFDRRKQSWHDKLAGTVVVRSVHRGPEAVRFDHA